MLSSPIVVTPPAAEPIERAQAKLFLKIDGTALDDQVDMLIAASRTELENITGQRLVTQTVKILAETFGDLEHLPLAPIGAIVEIRYQDSNGEDQVLAPGSYELFGAGLERGIRPAIGATWPMVRSVKGAIAVTLAVGYGEDGTFVPQNLIFALYALIRGKKDNSPVDIGPLIVNDRIWL